MQREMGKRIKKNKLTRPLSRRVDDPENEHVVHRLPVDKIPPVLLVEVKERVLHCPVAVQVVVENHVVWFD